MGISGSVRVESSGAVVASVECCLAAAPRARAGASGPRGGTRGGRRGAIRPIRDGGGIPTAGACVMRRAHGTKAGLIAGPEAAVGAAAGTCDPGKAQRKNLSQWPAKRRNIAHETCSFRRDVYPLACLCAITGSDRLRPAGPEGACQGAGMAMAASYWPRGESAGAWLRSRWQEDFPIRWEDDHEHLSSVITTICVPIGVIVTVQLWLLSTSVEAVLAGQTGPTVPATIASLVLFCVSAGILRYHAKSSRACAPEGCGRASRRDPHLPR